MLNSVTESKTEKIKKNKNNNKKETKTKTHTAQKNVHVVLFGASDLSPTYLACWLLYVSRSRSWDGHVDGHTRKKRRQLKQAMASASSPHGECVTLLATPGEWH